MSSLDFTRKHKHPECGHCQHIIDTPVKLTGPAAPSGHEATVMSILLMYKSQALTRNQIIKASGLRAVEVMDTLRELVRRNDVAFSGENLEARNAKYKLFGKTL